MEKGRSESARIRSRFQRSEPVDKIIHNVSGLSSSPPRSSSITTTTCPILLPLLVQCQARFHGHERRGLGLEPGSDAAERLALATLLRVLPRAEEGLTPRRVGGEGRAAVGLDCENVRLESERVDEL